jgi:hypothetical protein
MSTPVVVNGVTYNVPEDTEEDWGQQVHDLLVALSVIGSLTQSFANVVSVTTTPVTIVSGRTYLVNTSTAKTLTLPTAALNAFFIVRDVTGSAATNNITLARAGTETIDGAAANKTLTINNGAWIFVCDGTNWWQITMPDLHVLDVIATYAALTPVFPAATAANLAARLGQIAYQALRLNVVGGNWYDAFSWLSAITPAAPGATATDLTNRLAQIVSQIKTITAETNWYDATGPMLRKSGGTMTGNITYTDLIDGDGNDIATKIALWGG